MLPWTPPASLSLQQQQQQQQQQHHHQQGLAGSNPSSSPMQHAPQSQQHQQPQQPQYGQQPQSGQQHGVGPLEAPATGAPTLPNQINLGQVLHYLQTEWRRYERERNEWEIERGEMRARIALLEGERRGNENLKTDLMRRVKMLEYALRQERQKYLTQQHAQAQAAAQQAQATKDKERKDSKDTQSESGSVEDDKDSEKAGSDKPDKDSKKDDNLRKAMADKKKVQLQAPSTKEGTASAKAGSQGDEDDKPAVPEVIVSAATAAASSVSLTRPSSTVALPALLAAAQNGAGSIGANVGNNTIGVTGLAWHSAHTRDPRGRAKSREYLKQCLQEISYLTSASALNPLPERGVAGLHRPRKTMLDMPVVPGGQAFDLRQAQRHNVDGSAQEPLGPTDREPADSVQKSEPNQRDVSNGTADAPQVEAAREARGDTNGQPFLDRASGVTNIAATSATSTNVVGSKLASSVPNPPLSTTAPDTSSQASVASNSSPIVRNSTTLSSLPPEGDSNSPEINNRGTAIFRPDNTDEWRKALKKAGQSVSSPKTGDSELSALISESQADVAARRLRSDSSFSTASSATAVNESQHQVWKPRRTIRSHLDCARCLAFDQTKWPWDVMLITAGDDCTLKIWRMDRASLSASARNLPVPDSKPAHTYRGHRAPVTAVCISSGSGRIFSSSLDATIGVWQIPSQERDDPYAPFEPHLNLRRLEGHTDAVWDVCLLANAADAASGQQIEIIASASADGTVKVWNVSRSQQQTGQSSHTAGSGDGQPSGSLKLSWYAGGTDGSEEGARPVPTSLALCQNDMTRLAVAYQDSLVRIFDVETGKLVQTLKANETHDGTPATQINRIVSHPTLALLITAHEDGFIRIFDLATGTCTHSMQAHSDAVTALDVDPAGLTLASASHDGIIRFWDLLQSRKCIQEIPNAHRIKAGEGVLDLRYHPTHPYVASAGADGSIRVYG